MLTEYQKRYLNRLAHPLKPIVSIGQQGITDGVIGELGAALDAHELVKLKIYNNDRNERQRLMHQAAAQSKAEIVGSIGHVAILYRSNPRKKSNPIRVPAAP